jgi:hypothetical protein
VLPETDMEYFGDDGDRMQMMFNFHVNQHQFYAGIRRLPSAGQGARARSLSSGAHSRDPLARPGRRRVLVTISR